MSNIIKTVNLSKSFFLKKNLNILKKINIEIKKGDLVALLGPSGSGKSTFLHMIALLDQPSNGEIYFERKKTSQMNDVEKDELRGKKISIIYQQNNLLPDFTALENVYLARLSIENNKKKAIELAKKIITKMGLIKRINHYPSELSGGEMQRIAIARALINEPEIILADEPTGSLDHSTAKEVFKTLYKLKSKNRLIIYATHNRFFANMADCKLEMIDVNIKTINARIK